MRMDFITRKHFPREEMIRLVKIDGKFMLDNENKTGKRGFYLHSDEAEITSLFRSKKILRFLKEEEEREQLLQEILNIIHGA